MDVWCCFGAAVRHVFCKTKLFKCLDWRYRKERLCVAFLQRDEITTAVNASWKLHFEVCTISQTSLDRILRIWKYLASSETTVYLDCLVLFGRKLDDCAASSLQKVLFSITDRVVTQIRPFSLFYTIYELIFHKNRFKNWHREVMNFLSFHLSCKNQINRNSNHMKNTL